MSPAFLEMSIVRCIGGKQMGEKWFWIFLMFWVFMSNVDDMSRVFKDCEVQEVVDGTE